MKINEATPNQYTISIQTTVGHQKIGRRILEHLRKKDIQEPSTKDSCRAAKEAACQIRAKVTTEAPTHLNLCTACIMAAKLTTAPKIVPSSLSQKEKWTMILQILRSKPHPEKLTTPCNELLTTSNILHPILLFFHHNTIRTLKLNLWHTTNPTIMLQPITRNLHQLPE
jgi:hypothetical protein